MNLPSYISSGIIERYVAGLATAEEEAEIEQRRKLYPELELAIAQIEREFENHMLLEAVAPPERLKNEILRRIMQEEKQQIESREAAITKFNALFLIR